MFHPLHILSVGILGISYAVAAGPVVDSPDIPEKVGAPVQVGSAAETNAAPQVAPLMADAEPESPTASPLPEFDVSDLDLLWPVETRTISSAWGPRVRMMTTVVRTPAGSRRVSKPYAGVHKGIDLTAPLGNVIYAAMDGRVSDVGRSRGLGNFVKISHGNGVETVYGHNSANLVRVGERVQRGQIIARVGNTGHSTGPHVHFEVRVDGRQVNPMPMLNDTDGVSAEMAEYNERFLRHGKATGVMN